MSDYSSEMRPSDNVFSDADIFDEDDAFHKSGPLDPDGTFKESTSFELDSNSSFFNRFSRQIIIACYALAVFGACSALVSAMWLDSSRLAAALVGGAAYTSAVVSDLANRMFRLSEHGLASRPKTTAGLRLAVFAAAVAAVWISSTGTSVL